MSLRNPRVQKARAIVIREKSVGESNKQLTLLAKDAGKLTVFVRGAKKQGSKFLQGAQGFCYCDFVLYNGGDFLSVTQVDLIRNFSSNYNDIWKLMYGGYILELVDKTIMLSQEANDIMLLLLKALRLLENADSPEKIAAAFSIKLLDLLGFRPDVLCSSCGETLLGGELIYSAAGFGSGDGFFCRNCGSGGKTASAGAVKAISYILDAQRPGDAFSFTVTESVLEELKGLAEALIAGQLDLDLESVKIIKSL